jgi:hypothetical protein
MCLRERLAVFFLRWRVAAGPAAMVAFLGVIQRR